VQPNLLINFGLVVVGSLVFGFIYIYLFPEEKYDLNLVRRQKKTKGKTLSPDLLRPKNQAGITYEETDDNEQPMPPGNIHNILR
jgi:hypothetical protein